MQKQFWLIYLIVILDGGISNASPENATFSEHLSCVPPLWFQCSDKEQCVAYYFYCDGDMDCRDGSDEKDCKDKVSQGYATACKSTEWQCKDHFHCIKLEEYCNGQKDCIDGSDEPPDCGKNRTCNEFRCKNGKCIEKSTWICDGADDCGDGSDEDSCDKLPIKPSNCNNTIGKYLCDNKNCVSLSVVCNNVDDCGDGSDENPIQCVKAQKTCNETHHCQHNCSATPKGSRCFCNKGYVLKKNGTCEDKNECKEYGVCSQICRNLDGSHECDCEYGYKLQSDNKSCKAETGEALLIFASKTSIRGYYLESQIYFPIAENLQHVVGVSLDSNYVYWTDIQVGDETIFRSLEDGTKKEVVVTAGLGCPEDIAIEWVTMNIYFTDSLYKHIGVCTKDGSFCSVLIKEDTEKPRGIALLPSEGLMFWSDWGSNPQISSAYLDGSNRKSLVKDDIGWPNGLTIDYPARRLYWVDAKIKSIFSIQLDGEDRRTVLHDVAKHPYSISIFEDKLYWSDWSTNAIHSCNKFSGKDFNTLFQKNESVYGIHIYHSTLKVKTGHPCLAKPCSELCLLSANRTYTCACSLDKELNDDKHTCKDSKKRMHLAIAAGNTVIDYYHELLGRPRMSSSVTSDRITTMTYDSIANSLIAVDEVSKSIFRFNTQNSAVNYIIPVVNEWIECIAFDYFGNNLYKSDPVHKKIDVHSLTTGEKTEFSFTSSPYDLVVVPEEGIMFVVFRTNNDFHIDKSQLNGLGSRSHLIEYGLLGPRVSLAYDFEDKRLYWADEGTGRIESVDNQGQNRLLFRTGLNSPVNIAIMDSQIFWTTRKSNRLNWGDKKQSISGNKGMNLQVASKIDIIHLQAIYGSRKSDHLCRKNNGECSHICLVTNSTQKLCACPTDLMINTDQKTCRTKTTCLSNEFKCSNDKCINNIQRCNGIVDCHPGGEDEKDCTFGSSSCQPDEFACRSGECIKKINRCDSNFDCKDHSDEELCCTEEEFRCRDGTCISNFLVCNGSPDCPGDDLSDEDCAGHACNEYSFQCSSGLCIPKNWECDGDSDCGDGSDEHQNCKPQEEKCENMFSCHNGMCIDERLECNRVNDCGDNSDELNCPKDKFEALICPKEFYTCRNSSICIRQNLRCNSQQDCPHGDDEEDCYGCLGGDFLCNNGKCIPNNWTCDLTNDCGDNSDELLDKCDSSKSHTRPAGSSPHGNCSKEEFACSTGFCVPIAKACDETHDCLDGSDEEGQCEEACKTNSCDNVCHKTPLGAVCSCREGYKLGPDAKSCEDVNECERNACPQLCTNQPGSYTCSCYEGYALRLNRVSCKATGPPVKVITASKEDIWIMSPNSPHSSFMVLHRPNYEVNGLDVDARSNSVYWSNDYWGLISKMNIDTKNISSVESGVGRAEILTFDWVTGLVYYFENGNSPAIKVCNVERKKCAFISFIDSHNNKVTALAIEPIKEILFWAEAEFKFFEKTSGKIMRSGLAGENKTCIAHENLGIVSGLTIDHHRSILYWADHTNSRVESVDFNGVNRKIIESDLLYKPVGLNLYEDSLYWKSETNGVLRKLQLYGDMTYSLIPMGNTNFSKFFVISQVSRQPTAPNKCQDFACSHICIVRKGMPICICEDGLEFSDGEECLNDLLEDKVGSSSATVFPDIQITKVSASSDENQSNTGMVFFMSITLVICGVLYGGYYIKKRPELLNEVKIYFRNGRSDNLNNSSTSSFNTHQSILLPGQHEYPNPMNQLEYNPLMSRPEVVPGKHLDVLSEISDGELVEIDTPADIRLIK